jgi:FAD:protein FMN transferase
MSRPLREFQAMGCRILVAGADSAEFAAVQQLFADRERTFSRFVTTSELSLVNRAAGRPVVVSTPFARALDCALWAADETDGLVDPTIGAALAAAGYDRDFPDIDADDTPAPAGPVAGWRSLRQAGRLVHAPAVVSLDLNGVVKAMAVDDALSLIADDGWVSAGGDLATRGGVDVALPGGGAIRVASGAIATSGSTRRAWYRAGRRAHHLIDPRSGLPSDSPWTQVSACGANCLHADVAARAAFLLGDEGPDWLDERGVAGRFVDAGGAVVVNGTWRAGAGAEVASACT